MVPADNKWFSRLVVLCAVIKKLASICHDYPAVSDEKLKAFEGMRRELEK